MTIQLSPKIKKLVDKRAKEGGYGSPEAVILAGLLALEQQHVLMNLPGDVVKALVNEGEQSSKHAPVPLAEAYRQHLQHRKRRTRPQRKSA